MAKFPNVESPLDFAVASLRERASAWALTESQAAEWNALLDELRGYKLQDIDLRLANVSRKWEVVSAYQKAIRRGDQQTVLRMVSAMRSYPKEYQYWIRRAQVTAAEDIGPASPVLMLLVVEALALCTPHAAGEETWATIFEALSVMMAKAKKSRAYCSLSIIEERWDLAAHDVEDNPAGVDQFDPFLSVEQQNLLMSLFEAKKDTSALGAYIIKNSWRTERLMKYMAYPKLKLELVPVGVPLTEAEVLYGLPEYAYDGHTRTGQRALVLACGTPEIKKLFEFLTPEVRRRINEGKGGKIKFLTWLLFMVEGGLLADALVDPEVQKLEQRVVAASFGLWLAEWDWALMLMRDALPSIRACRKAALSEAYA